jgi:hypothetical protein
MMKSSLFYMKKSFLVDGYVKVEQDCREAVGHLRPACCGRDICVSDFAAENSIFQIAGSQMSGGRVRLRYILVCIDSFSKYLVATALTDITAPSVATVSPTFEHPIFAPRYMHPDICAPTVALYNCTTTFAPIHMRVPTFALYNCATTFAP